MPSRRQRLEWGLILLLNELLQFGMYKIPPVILFLIIGQTILFAGYINVPWEKEDVCISGNTILSDGDWKRLILSVFEHGDDMHLYYNMVFLCKGRSLEKKYGSLNFGFILLFLTLISNIMYVALAFLLAELTNNSVYMRACAIGFSAGVTIPGKYAAWIEVILIHLLVANSSFRGHLGGVLAGVIYCYTTIGRCLDDCVASLTGYPVFHREDISDNENTNR